MPILRAQRPQFQKAKQKVCGIGTSTVLQTSNLLEFIIRYTIHINFEENGSSDQKMLFIKYFKHNII